MATASSTNNQGQELKWVGKRPLRPDGIAVAAFYDMIKIDDQWRINGCRIAKLPGEDV